MYTVVKEFAERFDNRRIYKIGNTYPREGYIPPKGRAEALCVKKASNMNKTGDIFLVKAEHQQEGGLSSSNADQD